VEFRNSDGGVASEITSLAVETLRVPEHVAPSGGAGTRKAPDIAGIWVALFPKSASNIVADRTDGRDGLHAAAHLLDGFPMAEPRQD